MNACCPLLSEKSTFKDVLKALCQPAVHRVPMMGKATFKQELFGEKEKRPLERFLTQSDLLKFVADHLDDFGAAVDVTIDNKLGTRPVYCVSATSKTIDAFRELVNRKVTALGVIDDDGVLVGNVSVRDIRFIVKQNMGAELNSSLDDFATDIRKHNPDIPKDVIACVESDTVRSVITKLYNNRIHRLYIVDSEHKPLGVISLGDVFHYLLESLSPDNDKIL